MTHAAIVDASKLHGAKPTAVTTHPLWDAQPSFNGELAVGTDGQAYLVYNEDDVEAGWIMALDSTKRLESHHAAPTPFGDTAAGGYCALWPGVSAAMPDPAVSPTAYEVISSTIWPFCEYAASGGASKTATLYYAIPDDFSAWGGVGIRFYSRCYAVAGSCTVKIELMDPATGTSFSTAVAALRSGVVANETTYQALIFADTPALAGKYSAGDLLKIVITFTVTGSLSSCYFSLLEFNWS